MRKREYSDYRRVIAESWSRCIAWGLAHEHEPELIETNIPELKSNRQAYSELRSTVEAVVVPYYKNVLSNSRCLILLTDDHANVLQSWGDERITEQHLKPWFQPGANWQERVCGTNAIGTAIATDAPIQIQRNEHFLKINRSLIGSAAPIHDAQNRLVGVLSVFSDAYLPQAHTLGMVRLLSQSVENRLIIRQFEFSHFQITLNTTADNFDSPWSGILICDDSGFIKASNQRAGQLLGVNTAGKMLNELFTNRCTHILEYPEHAPMELMTRGKVRLSARLKRPLSLSEGIKQPGTRQLNSTPLPAENELFQLEYGDLTVRRCADQALKVLRKGVPVLITGETGVGKEVLMRALHSNSDRREQSLVSVNCAAIPPELVESELFGYEPGAFTGAKAQGSLGLIRKADRGILFLDEIGEMPLAAQSRLLRVLQEREVTPVGSTERIPVDILLVTATNRSLASYIDTGRFRADLYYRINGLAIELPPLRVRTDKHKLIQSIYREHRDNEQPAELSPSVVAALESHPWPGNIRQLTNVLRVAIAIADGEEVQLWHLPEDFLAELGQQLQTSADDAKTEATDPGMPEPFAMTLRAYHQCMGNISRTAKELGISRNTLYKRLRELGVR
ncbi:MAG TPA: sigma-54-dependent Fis family transcriptional regulator [Marinobacter sp.]|nr:sigma-54-dependent Fis family transcriptional regulator [Marinobacter sp.]